jgi:hypothetical protein
MPTDIRSIIALAGVLAAFGCLAFITTRRRAKHPMRFVDQRLFDPPQYIRWR